MYGILADWDVKAPWQHYKEADFHSDDIYTEIIFMKYKEEIQVITTVNEFSIFHTNLSNQHDANYHEIRSHMRRFIIRVYAGAPKDSFL